jgi:hypothetical protein
VRKADNLLLSCADVNKSGDRKLLEPFGPVQACNGTALTFIYRKKKKKLKIPNILIFNISYILKYLPPPTTLQLQSVYYFLQFHTVYFVINFSEITGSLSVNLNALYFPLL